MTAMRQTLGLMAFWVAVGGGMVAWGQGSLTPPAGVPSPSMKTLGQIEPRVPISYLPFSITQPGSYYLTANLNSTGHGITIWSGFVTVDLMGFTIQGDGGAASTDTGILLNGTAGSPLRDVVVRNGCVRKFNRGITCLYGTNCRFEFLGVSSNAAWGLQLGGSYSGWAIGNLIANSSFSANGEHGITATGQSGTCVGNRLLRCVVTANGSHGISGLGSDTGKFDGNLIEDCQVFDNRYRGINIRGNAGQCNANTITRCAVYGNKELGIGLYASGGRCVGNTVSDSMVSSNSTDGIYLAHAEGNSIERCVVAANGRYGIELSASSASSVCSGNRIIACTVVGSGNYGIWLSTEEGACEGNVIADCVVRDNATEGISLYQANGNRIENNHVSRQRGGSTYGIRTSGTSRNLIARNYCVGHTSNYSLSANDTYGPVVTTVGALGSGVSAHPWANFSL